MMRPLLTVLAAICIAAAFLIGCQPDETPVNEPAVEETAPPASDNNAPKLDEQPDSATGPDTANAPVEDMLKQWHNLAKTASRDESHLSEVTNLAYQIAAKDSQALLSLLDLVEAPDSTPYQKVLATLSIVPALNPQTAPRLIAMTEPGKDGTTRACAANMLRHVYSSEATEALRALTADSEPRVALYAKIGMALRDPEARSQIHQMCRMPSVSIQEKGTIIETLAGSPNKSDMPLMTEILEDSSTDNKIRLLAINAISQIGGEEQKELLTKHSENGTTEEIRTAAKNALRQVSNKSEGQSELVLPM